jgi:hypothetical protein
MKLSIFCLVLPPQYKKQNIIKMRITDNNYELPEITALRVIETAQTGANRPLFIRGRNNKTKQKGFYVLKYQGAERMDNRTSGRELLAAFLAQEWGLTVPEPVKIIVNDNFFNHIMGHEDFKNIQKSKGCLNFGNVKIMGDADILNQTALTPQQVYQAAQVFIFDLIIQNADRRFEKPNMFLAKGKINLIDHELAFGFLDTLPFLRSPKPYILNETDVNSAKNHFFYRTLHSNKRLETMDVFQTFNNLPYNFWDKVREKMPMEWQTPEINQIEAHITQILDNFELFKIEITTKLWKL